MPELPEVEVTRRQIRKVLVNRTIASVETTRASYFFLTRPAALKEKLVGRRVTDVERVGKYLVAHLDDGARVLLHLGMTGQLFTAGAASPRLISAAKRRALASDAQAGFTPDVHTHIVIEFREPGPKLYFRDVRKFGKVAWIAAGDSHERLERLGVDALRASGDVLWEAARRRSTPIKTLLLDQAVIAGIGNIYADEALFLAGVRPTRPARRVTRAECEALVDFAKQVMRRSIQTGGSSISDYVQPDGSDGGYQKERRVYGREGERCQRCDGVIERLVIAGRSSHFCPKCQR
jgi:formamidopyrimidine-DNA glycosylase